MSFPREGVPPLGVMLKDRRGFMAGMIQTASSWDCTCCVHAATIHPAVCGGSLSSCLRGGWRYRCLDGIPWALGFWPQDEVQGTGDLPAIPSPYVSPPLGGHQSINREKSLGTSQWAHPSLTRHDMGQFLLPPAKLCC